MEKLHVKYDKSNSLDREFNNFIRSQVTLTDDRVEIYNYVVSQLAKNGMYIYLGELKYRITDGENPNEVMLDIINRDEITKSIFWHIKRRIQEYLDDDLYGKFYSNP